MNKVMHIHQVINNLSKHRLLKLIGIYKIVKYYMVAIKIINKMKVQAYKIVLICRYNIC
jgi:hypothetical protein